MRLTGVILSGGYGRRFLPITDKSPKGCVGVGGIPLFVHHCLKLRGLVDNVVFQTRARKIINEDEMDWWQKELKIPISIHQTEGSVYSAFNSLYNAYSSDNYMLINGDIISNVNYKNVFRQHKELKSDVTVVCSSWPGEKGKAIPEEFKKKSSNLNLMGISIMNRRAMEVVGRLSQFRPSSEQFWRIVTHEFIQKGYRMGFYKDHRFWKDIGKPITYYHFHRQIFRHPFFWKPYQRWCQIDRKREIIQRKESVIKSQKIKNTTVGKNCFIGKDCVISNSVVLDNCFIPDNCRLENVLVKRETRLKNKRNFTNVIIGNNRKRSLVW